MILVPEKNSEEFGAQWIGRLTTLPFYFGPLLSGFLLFIVYVLLAEWSYYFVIPPSSNAVFWLPSCITVSIFIRARRIPKVWPFWLMTLFLAEFFVLTHHHVPMIAALFWSLSNVVLPLSVLLLARQFVKGRFNFRQTSDVFTFAFITLVGVTPSSLLAGLGTCLAFPNSQYFDSVISWGTSDALGIILGAPVLLSWTAKAQKPLGDRKEGILLIVLLGLISILSLTYPKGTILDRSFFSFLILFVAWAAIRFGPRGTTLVLLVFDLVEVWLTTKGFGPFAFNDLSSIQRINALQLLVANIGFLMLLLAAAIDEQRTARIRAEEALNQRDEFISMASHELKTPLTSITMQIQMLNLYAIQGTIHKMPLDKLVMMSEISNREIKRFTNLINDLLDVTKIKNGKLSLHLEKVNLSELIDEVIGRFKAEVNDSDSKVSIKVDPQIWGLWDRLRVDQIITNLLSNAMKFGKGKPIEISGEMNNSMATIIVKDHGIGISSENQERVFERFERAVTLKEFSGLGLGLYIVRQAVEGHGGKVRVEGQLGQGTSFIVELPILL
jgi:signal transduction histidine kinase